MRPWRLRRVMRMFPWEIMAAAVAVDEKERTAAEARKRVMAGSKFLFHGNSDEKKLHLIACNSTAIPRQHGGLGIDAIAIYFGFSCSFIWRLYNANSLVSSWFKAKYESPWKSSLPTASKTWKLICATAIKIKPVISFAVAPHAKFSMLWDLGAMAALLLRDQPI
ncbi:hypothetical protein M5K25_014216 [Dendrobium thyrsiflorum]|uniref:Uncharacterized protein n=1 Tax=Dendrobium thyrsiflorum TaxID=117978 RepID=A0ABD0V287_DENTH